jgi:primase-polymerase (primpol)-like protein
VDIDSIPLGMVVLDQWVLWKYENVNGRITKIPYQPNGKKATFTRKETWSSIEDVCEVADKFDGIGFVFTEDSGIARLDLDHVKKELCGTLRLSTRFEASLHTPNYLRVAKVLTFMYLRNPQAT